MHEHQERYSALVMAKLRQDNVLKDGVVFKADEITRQLQTLGCSVKTE